MKKISTFMHKWLGLILSLWLLLVSITGTLLFFKNDLLIWSYPILENHQLPDHEQALDVIDRIPGRYAFLPSEHHPWIESIHEDGARYYYSADGDLLVAREAYGDWIDWFVQFHHHLLLKDFGEDLQGILSIGAILLMFFGLIKWWPKKRWQWKDFKIRLARPGQAKWGQTLWQSHRTLGVILFLPVLLLIVTGSGMIYNAQFKAFFNLFSDEIPIQEQVQHDLSEAKQWHLDKPMSWKYRLENVKQYLPQTQPVMLYLSSPRLRMRLPQEWHPNGRSFVGFEKDSNRIVEIIDYRNYSSGSKVSQVIYPLHIAFVGGLAFLLLMTMSGIVLIWLSISGVWFWLWCRAKRKKP